MKLGFTLFASVFLAGTFGTPTRKAPESAAASDELDVVDVVDTSNRALLSSTQKQPIIINQARSVFELPDPATISEEEESVESKEANESEESEESDESEEVKESEEAKESEESEESSDDTPPVDPPTMPTMPEMPPTMPPVTPPADTPAPSPPMPAMMRAPNQGGAASIALDDTEDAMPNSRTPSAGTYGLRSDDYYPSTYESHKKYDEDLEALTARHRHHGDMEY